MVEARARMDGVSFDPRREFDGALSVGTYTCARCSKSVRFTTRDFQRKFRSPSSGLKAEDRETIGRFRPLDASKWESFLDFYCPGRRRPVRVVFVPFEFAMGCYRFEATDIVEAA